MTSVYRRKLDEDTWHFCTNCSKWPWTKFEEADRPRGELCNECKTRKAAKDCR